jgi:hypothetical protein
VHPFIASIPLRGIASVHCRVGKKYQHHTVFILVINAQLALKMDQFNQLDNADPFFSPPPPSLLPTDASTSDALALPPLATYLPLKGGSF